jgi:lipoprotein-anchoring transpeptidase ErfK/SrfK
MRRHFHKAISHSKQVARQLHDRRILTTRKILVTLALINILILLYFLTMTVSFPRTLLAGHDIGLKTKQNINSYLTAMYETPIRLTIQDHTYDITYERMGIYIDMDHAMEIIYEPNTRGVIRSMNDFVRQTFYPRKITIPLSFSQEFYDFVDKINQDTTAGTDIIHLDQDNKQATLYEASTRYRVDSEEVKQILQNNFGTQQSIVTIPAVISTNTLHPQIDAINSKLQSVYANPINIIINIKGANHFIPLSSESLKYYSSAAVSVASDSITVSMNEETFKPALTQALAAFDPTLNNDTIYQKVYTGLTNSLQMRTRGHDVDSVKVNVDSGPNSDGSIAARYIEVDISQQKLFTFDKGSLVKTYRVSTGKDYPTPVGRFEILNKTGLGFSNIYDVWMPYWMGFSYSKELHAYFGIHELPYYYSGTDKIQRPRDFIGQPNTGGCVALDIGDSKEVYQFADIGTPVVIYQ